MPTEKTFDKTRESAAQSGYEQMIADRLREMMNTPEAYSAQLAELRASPAYKAAFGSLEEDGEAPEAGASKRAAAARSQPVDRASQREVDDYARRLGELEAAESREQHEARLQHKGAKPRDSDESQVAPTKKTKRPPKQAAEE